jgi:hypothetical protein
MDVLIVVAGAAGAIHLALCVIILARLRGNQNALEDLFAVPNKALAGATSRFRLLRARYYLPWVRLPKSVDSVDEFNRALIFLARIAGLVIPIAFLFSFLIPFLE